jgi:hypothetical protein
MAGALQAEPSHEDGAVGQERRLSRSRLKVWQAGHIELAAMHVKGKLEDPVPGHRSDQASVNICADSTPKVDATLPLRPLGLTVLRRSSGMT